MSKRFFNNDARPPFAALIQARRTEILDDFGILAGWRRQVKDAIATCAALPVEHVEHVIELFIALCVVKIGLEIMDTGSEPFPNLWIDRLLAGVLINRFEGLLAKLFIGVGTSREPYD